MTMTKGLVRLGTAAGLFALVLSLSAAFASTALAQGPPATMYGTASAGDEIGVWVGSASCGSVTAGSDGFWMMQIGEGAPCSPSDGDTLSFTMNGAATNETETWASGGSPADVANGVSLTAAMMETDGMAPEAGVMAPDTGNAGLLTQSSGTSPWLALALGALALGALAGTRAVARR